MKKKLLLLFGIPLLVSLVLAAIASIRPDAAVVVLIVGVLVTPVILVGLLVFTFSAGAVKAVEIQQNPALTTKQKRSSTKRVLISMTVLALFVAAILLMG